MCLQWTVFAFHYTGLILRPVVLYLYQQERCSCIRFAFKWQWPFLSIFQSAVVAAEGKIMLNLFTQNKLGVFQELVVEQPVQLCPLCRGVAVLILNGDAVDGKGGV